MASRLVWGFTAGATARDSASPLVARVPAGSGADSGVGRSEVALVDMAALVWAADDLSRRTDWQSVPDGLKTRSTFYIANAQGQPVCEKAPILLAGLGRNQAIRILNRRKQSKQRSS
jgi:hypothetical protein